MNVSHSLRDQGRQDPPGRPSRPRHRPYRRKRRQDQVRHRERLTHAHCAGRLQDSHPWRLQKYPHRTRVGRQLDFGKTSWEGVQRPAHSLGTNEGEILTGVLLCFPPFFLRNSFRGRVGSSTKRVYQGYASNKHYFTIFMAGEKGVLEMLTAFLFGLVYFFFTCARGQKRWYLETLALIPRHEGRSDRWEESHILIIFVCFCALDSDSLCSE